LAKFQTVKKALGESFEESLESSKWNVAWQRRGGLTRLEMLSVYFRFPETVEASRVI